MKNILLLTSIFSVLAVMNIHAEEDKPVMERVGNALNDAGETVHEYADKTAETVGEYAEKAGDKIQKASEKAGEKFQELKEKASDKFHEYGDDLCDFADKLEHKVEKKFSPEKREKFYKKIRAKFSEKKEEAKDEIMENSHLTDTQKAALIELIDGDNN